MCADRIQVNVYGYSESVKRIFPEKEARGLSLNGVLWNCECENYIEPEHDQLNFYRPNSWTPLPQNFETWDESLTSTSSAMNLEIN